MKPYLSIIIPAYNEARRLPVTLVDIDRVLEKAPYSYEIIVVNDGSLDATSEICKRFSHIMKEMRVIDHIKNKGKGEAVKTGMLAAHGTVRLFTDADNSTSLDQFEKMIPFFKEEYDVVIGSRSTTLGAKLEPPQSFIKQLAGKLGNFIIRVTVLPGIHDSQCGFKCFSESSAEKIFGVLRVTQWAFDVEALALARKYGYRIKEMPVRWVNDRASKVTLGAYFKTFFEVIKISWWIKHNVYEKNTS